MRRPARLSSLRGDAKFALWRPETTDLRIVDVRVTENAGEVAKHVETRRLPSVARSSRLLRFWVKAPNSNSEIATTCLARAAGGGIARGTCG
jgi:hypothetical protein